ncbi:MAG: hypothetical protein QGH39_01460, partial [Candidatus Thermoplasmatota archaeon]|nr:hypothetical protein [Candidatus Thermoplasmatota archaeon]
DSLQIVGIEILDFLEDFLPNNRLVALLVREFPIRKGEDFETTLVEPRYIRFIESIAELTTA